MSYCQAAGIKHGRCPQGQLVGEKDFNFLCSCQINTYWVVSKYTIEASPLTSHSKDKLKGEETKMKRVAKRD